MKRIHIHVGVEKLDESIRFYSAIFGAQPVKTKADYAKWMLEDPRVNFAISNTGRSPGIDHLGIQAESGQALAMLGHRLDAAGGAVVPEDAAVCCYARSDKLWTEDPQGTRWETFHTVGEATTYYAGESACATDGAACTPDVQKMQPAPASREGACCAPASACC